MIVPKLWARLGNQAFMIAAAIAHAKKMNTDWAVPGQTLDPRIWPTYFKNLPYTTYNLANLLCDKYKEQRHCYDPLPQSSSYLQIEGYFQSEKYFENAKVDIGNALGFHCNKQDYIAVHVRRGDYLHYTDQFPVLPVEYYIKAIAEIIVLGYVRFKIYSDDMPWCKYFFSTQYFSQIKFEYSRIKDPLTDMRDMYNAAGFIIANSSFSLFPALLRLDNPPVIAPAENRWFGPKNIHLETFDLMPERFIKI